MQLDISTGDSIILAQAREGGKPSHIIIHSKTKCICNYAKLYKLPWAALTKEEAISSWIQTIMLKKRGINTGRKRPDCGCVLSGLSLLAC